MTTRFDNSALLKIVEARKIHLAVIVLVAAVLGYVFSGEAFIKPKFKSTAIVYPVNIIPYSMESPTEQLLQLFHSADVRTMMAKRFNLADHYHIGASGTAAATRLYLEYDENVMIRKTEFESIKIDIYDENPDTASAMVDGIINCVNIKARMLQREKTGEVVRIFSDQLRVKQKQIDSLENINNELRTKYGLLDYKAQAKEATKSYLKLVSDGASREKIHEVDSMMHNLEAKGGEQVSVNDQLQGLRESYNAIKGDYDKAISDLTKELTYSNVIAKPFPADSKSYPVRSIIVLVCALSALLLGVILFVLMDRKPEQTNAGAEQQ